AGWLLLAILRQPGGSPLRPRLADPARSATARVPVVVRGRIDAPAGTRPPPAQRRRAAGTTRPARTMPLRSRAGPEDLRATRTRAALRSWPHPTHRAFA